jgi:hypothetical protein
VTVRSRIVVGAVLSLLVHASVAAAQETTAAADIERGVKLMNQSDFAGALDAFSAAREKSPSAEAVSRMAMAEQGLKRWADAEIHIEIALSQADDPWIKKYRPFLEEASAAIAKHLGNLDVQGAPDGGVIAVDGEVIGILPLRKSRLLTVGQHQLKITAPDHESTVRTIQIAAGQTTKLTVILKSMSAPAKTGGATPATAPEPVRQPEAAAPASSQHWLSTVGIAALLAGSAALVAAGVIAIHNQNDTIYKPIAIAASATEVVGFGLFLFDQTRGPPSQATTSTGRTVGLGFTWSF